MDPAWSFSSTVFDCWLRFWSVLLSVDLHVDSDHRLLFVRLCVLLVFFILLLCIFFIHKTHELRWIEL